MNYIYDFSIIIPAHNATEYINTALDSIIWQNYDFKKIEVIVIDDGSNDNLKSWIQGYLHKYENIKFYTIEYLHWGGAINFVSANKLANGKYISILDPDDKLIYDCFSTIASHFNDESIDLFISDFYVWKMKWRSNGKIIDKLRYQKIIFSSGNKNFTKRKNIEKTRTPWAISLCKFYKKELFYILPKLLEYIDYQDCIFFNNAIDMVHSVRYIPKALGWWRNKSENSITTRKWDKYNCDEWLITIYNLINQNAKLIALFYIYYYIDFKEYLKSRNIKIRIPKNINMRWIPYGLRHIVKWFLLLINRYYIDH